NKHFHNRFWFTLVVFNDHEECGSTSYTGADSIFLKSVLERILVGPEEYAQGLSGSMLISCDNAHALHPNYPEKFEENHSPLINMGPVIKMNHNQRYATDGLTAAIFISLCQENKIPYQQFVIRSDLTCGSTIGPTTSAQLGIKTLDIGVPTWSMHSSREVAGARDSFYLYRALGQFFNAPQI
ncbi:MAG: M18 family aminopeptidase, partial [Pseudomonadota bacterium]